jgi:predicted dehydrogenase
MSIEIAVIAAGARSRVVVGNLLRAAKGGVHIAALYDPDVEVARMALAEWHLSDEIICNSYQEAMARPGINWVMIFSPNAFHKEHILAAFAAGKNVFSEKPLATSIADCQEIYEASQRAGVLFATGFVLRYSKMYGKVKEILASGALGKLLAINADENIPPDHGGYIMRNWRRNTAIAGPHILEKCCHDLDLINWYCESLPTRVVSFGRRDFFVPENESLMEKYGRDTFCSWLDPHGKPSPFTSDKDLMDNQTSIAEYRNGIIVTFQCTMSNPMPERRMLFCCSEGTMKVELYSSTLCYKRMGEDYVHSYNFGADAHGGGDEYIAAALLETMQTGSAPKCSGSEGLQSAVYALAIDQAARTGKIVDLEPIWQSLNR